MNLYDETVEAGYQAIKQAETSLPRWALNRLESAIESEEGVSLRQLEAIKENIRSAENKEIPVCQDTGLIMFYIELGRDFPLDFSLEEALNESVKKATEEIPLRPSIVDPLTRENTEDNTGIEVPKIDIELVEGDKLDIDVLIKGGGSENVAKQKMFLPSQVEDISSWVVEKIKEAGGKPCPPIYIGVGIGGSMDISAELAKKALMKKPNQSKAKIGRLEDKILREVNQLGIGPMGLGGKTTSLGVSIMKASCHTASLPVSMNVQCWATRTASKRVKNE